MNGQPVTHLTAGVYEITVNDRSRFHNFHLSGPGVDRSTTEDFVGTQTWTVTLTDGVFNFHVRPARRTDERRRSPSGRPSHRLRLRPPVQRCKVPKVVGKRLAVAKRAITRARCRVGRIRRAWSKKKARGMVVKQTPRAGVRRPRGTRVNLVVSRGRR